MLCASVWNVTLFLESALGVDASLLWNVSLTSTGGAGTVRDDVLLFVVVMLLDWHLLAELQMLLEFTLSSQAKLPNWLLLRQLYSGGDSGTVSPGNVTVQSLPIVQRSFGTLIVNLLSYAHALFAFCDGIP